MCATGSLAVFSLIRWLSRGGLGGGDVKLGALAGAVVGYSGIPLASLIMTVAGGATATALLALRRVERASALPYGPFIALGAVATLLR